MFLSNEQSSFFSNINELELTTLIDNDINEFLEETANLEMAFVRFEHTMIMESKQFMIQEGVKEFATRILNFIKSLFEKVINKIKGLFSKTSNDNKKAKSNAPAAEKTAKQNEAIGFDGASDSEDNKKNDDEEDNKKNDDESEPLRLTNESKPKKNKKFYTTKSDFSKYESFVSIVEKEIANGTKEIIDVVTSKITSDIKDSNKKLIVSDTSFLSTNYFKRISASNVLPRLKQPEKVKYDTKFVARVTKVMDIFNTAGQIILSDLEKTKNLIASKAIVPDNATAQNIKIAQNLKVARPLISSFLRNTTYLTAFVFSVNKDAQKAINFGAA